jgi:hypothetical protein
MVVEISSSDVPVVVDAIRVHKTFPMARCNYFSVECDSPTSGLAISVGGEELPLLILGLVGIITHPLSAYQFSSIDLIEDLFKRVEDETGLLIDVDDVWLPLFLFDTIGIEPEIGQVYRLKKDLFVLAFSFREGNLNIESFINECRRFEQPILFSVPEINRREV